jgi:uncharacterized membrane protein YcfT
MTNFNEFENLESKASAVHIKKYYSEAGLRAAITCLCLYKPNLRKLSLKKALLDSENTKALENIFLDETK